MSIGSSARLIQTIRDLSLFYFVLVLWNTSQMRFLLIAIVADKNQETLKKNYAFSQWTEATSGRPNCPGKLLLPGQGQAQFVPHTSWACPCPGKSVRN